MRLFLLPGAVTVLLVVIAIGLARYLSEVFEGDLIGTYVANYQGDKAELSLLNTHRFTNVIRTLDGKTFTNEGPWDVVAVGQSHTRLVVEFENFKLLPSYKSSANVKWETEAGRGWLGSPQLCFDADVGYCYTKQSAELK